MELVSGPDVGGGFLFQLTVVPQGNVGAFTYHAQEGGIDGGLRPVGSPELVGFQPTGTPCPIGGRSCWHREFELPLTENLQARFAYNRLRFVIGPMLAQASGAKPVPFVEGARTALGRIAPALHEIKIPWMVGGSSAPALLGAAISPGDLDILTGPGGVEAIAGALHDFLIEPVGRTRWGSGPVRMAARAYVGTFQDGLRVEWAEAVPEDRTSKEELGEWSMEALEHAIPAKWQGIEVPVAPPEFSLVKALVERRTERREAILRLIQSIGVDRPLLDQLSASTAMSGTVRSALGESLAGVTARSS